MQPFSLSDFSGGIQEAEGPGDFTNKQWSELRGFVPTSEVLVESQWPLQTIGSYPAGHRFHAVHPLTTEYGTYLITITETGRIYWASAPDPDDTYTVANAKTWTQITGIIDDPDYRFISDVSLAWRYRNADTQEFEDKSSSGILIHKPVGQQITKELTFSQGTSTNVITFTTSAAHGFSVGDWITIAGAVNAAGDSVAGTFRVNSVPTSTTFRVRATTATYAITAASGVATKTVVQYAYVIYFTAANTPAVKAFPDETRYQNDDYYRISSLKYDGTTGRATVYTETDHKFESVTVDIKSAQRKDNGRLIYTTKKPHKIQAGDLVSINGTPYTGGSAALNITNQIVYSVNEDSTKFTVESKNFTAISPDTTAATATNRRKIVIADTFQDYSGAYAGRARSIFDGTWYTLTGTNLTEDNQIVFSMKNAVISYERTSNVATLHVGYHTFLVGDSITVNGVGGGFDGTSLLITAVDDESVSYSNAGADVANTAATSSMDVWWTANYVINESSGFVASAVFLKQDRQQPQRPVDMWFQPYTYNNRDADHKFSNKAFPGKGIIPRASKGTMFNNRLILGNIEHANVPDLKIARRNVPAESPLRDFNTSPKESSIYYAGSSDIDVFDPRARINMGATNAEILGLHVVNQSLIAITESGGPQDGIISLKGNLGLILPYDGTQPNVYQVRKEVVKGNIGGIATPSTWVGHRQFSSAWPEAGAVTFVDKLGGVWYTNGTSADRLDRFGPRAPVYATEYDHTACLGKYGFVYRFNDPAEYFGNYLPTGGGGFTYVPSKNGKLHVFSILGNVKGEVNGAWTELIKPLSIYDGSRNPSPYTGTFTEYGDITYSSSLFSIYSSVITYPTQTAGPDTLALTGGTVNPSDPNETTLVVPGVGTYKMYRKIFVYPDSTSLLNDAMNSTWQLQNNPYAVSIPGVYSVGLTHWSDISAGCTNHPGNNYHIFGFMRFIPEPGWVGTFTVNFRQTTPYAPNPTQTQTGDWTYQRTISQATVTDHIKSMIGHGSDLYLINGGNVWRYATLGPYAERGKMNNVELRLILSTPTIGDPENQKKRFWHRFGVAFQTITGGKVVAMKTQARGALSKDSSAATYSKTKNATFTSGYGEAIIPAGIGKESVISGTVAFAGHIQLQSATFWSTGEQPSRDK